MKEKSASFAQSLPHDCAPTHVRGESSFVDDHPRLSNEVLVDFLFTRVANGRLLSIDLTAAQKVPGVVALYTAKDLAHNRWGSITADQPFLVAEGEEVGCVGEPMVVIAATQEAALQAAKRAIKIEIAPSPQGPILSIDQAIAHHSFLGTPQRMACGDAEKALAGAPECFEGIFTSQGQEHFYLESNATLVTPLDYDQLEILTSSQNPSELQHHVAQALGLQINQVNCTVKRMGGGFGGKETQAAHYATLAALVASKLKRPARLVLTKDDDMIITGKRHPFQTFYKVGHTRTGRITALQATLYADGGAYLDLSPAILIRALFHIDNAYYLENAEIKGIICKTNLPSNTAFRGFGGPQGMVVMEHILEEIARRVGRDPLEVRRCNLYSNKGDQRTPYGQVVKNAPLESLISRLAEQADYHGRRAQIQAWNQKSSAVTARGISLVPVKFGISFTTRFLNQGSALVNLYTDGTIQVSTGATEMGQGVNSNIRRLVSDFFGLPASAVQMMATSTTRNPNTSATAASSGSDINGAAALAASAKIKKRLIQFAKTLYPSDQWSFVNGQVSAADRAYQITFKDLVQQAYQARVNLGAQGFYKTPLIHFDPIKGKGRPFLYFTTGAAISEVEIDRFTGDTKIRRTDILMDLGRPVNPGIDLGQVSGAFIQGYGWVTMEDLCYNQDGFLLTHSPSTYKIPSIQDTPRIFNIDLVEGRRNRVNRIGSKAVGEPPFLLGVSVWTAIKDCLNQICPQNQLCHLPATPERILMQLGAWKNSF